MPAGRTGKKYKGDTEMYRHINQHIKALLDLLRKENHVQDYHHLMCAFAQTNAAKDEQFQRDYARFWAFGPGVNGAWRTHYFNLLEEVRKRRELTPEQRPELLKEVCHKTSNNHRGGTFLQFAFATKLVHMVDPTSPIFDCRVRAFYLLPHTNNGGTIKPRIDACLEVYKALEKEYARILDKHLLDESIALFRKEFRAEKFTPIKVIDSLIWAFVTWAKRGPAFGTGKLQYE